MISGRLLFFLSLLFVLNGCSYFDDMKPSELGLEDGWDWMAVPGRWEFAESEQYLTLDGEVWYRCFVKVPRQWRGHDLTMSLGKVLNAHEVYWNGKKVGGAGQFPPEAITDELDSHRYRIDAELTRPGKWSLLAIRVYNDWGFGGILDWHGDQWPVSLSLSCPQGWISLRGNWLFHPGEGMQYAKWPYKMDSREAGALAAYYDTRANEPPPLEPVGTTIPVEGGEGEWYIRTESDEAPPAPPLVPESSVGRVQDMIISSSHPEDETPLAWSAQPALSWPEACPLGNGRMGAMVYGRPYREKIDVAISSLWSGQDIDTNKPEMIRLLPEIRELLAKGRPVQAEGLLQSIFDNNRWTDTKQIPQALGSLRVVTTARDKGVHDYRRQLSDENGIATTSYRYKDHEYKSESFVSMVDDVLIYHLSSADDAAVTLAAAFESLNPANVKVNDDGVLVLMGLGGQHNGLVGNIVFAVAVKVVPWGGEAWQGTDRIGARDADDVTIILSAASSFKNFRQLTAPAGDLAVQKIEEASAYSYKVLRKRHTEAYALLKGRTRLRIGREGNTRGLAPLFSDNPSSSSLFLRPENAVALFDTARYLAISSAAADGWPPHPAGVWAPGLEAPEWMHYQLNSSLPLWQSALGPMNISAAPGNLLSYLDALKERGSTTARAQYRTSGWCAHMVSDLWASTSPGSRSELWPLGGAFVALQAWDQYKFNPTEENFEAVYPYLRESAKFILDYLVEYSDGTFHVSPSVSPGNRYRSGLVMTSFTDSAAVDTVVASSVFKAVSDAAKARGIDEALQKRCDQRLKHLPELTVSNRKTLREWLDHDTESDGPIMPHLYSVYPNTLITPATTPDLAKAAMRSLSLRTSEHTAWSQAFRACCWARLGRGDYALESLNKIAVGNLHPNGMTSRSRLDLTANMLAGSAIVEMLLQSHKGAVTGLTDGVDELALLPALPSVWDNGSVEGLKARGGHEIDILWEDSGRVVSTIRAGHDGDIRVRLPRLVLPAAIDLRTSAGDKVRFQQINNDTIYFAIKSGTTYSLEAEKIDE